METNYLTFEQVRLIFIVYASSILPLVMLSYLKINNLISSSIIKYYIFIFSVCAFGWEIWFTYGIIDGFPVDLRRADILNWYIPKNINWILNSLADAGTITFGGLYLTWYLLGKKNNMISSWSWSAFVLLMFLFLFQNIVVELFLYQDQLAVGKTISWAPLSPLSSFYNPHLFDFNGRSVFLQTQLPWIFMTPLVYYFFIKLVNKN